MKHDPLAEIAKRTQRYWYEDGIWEIAFGLLNLMLAGFYWITSSFNWEGPQAFILPLFQVGVILAGVWGINKLVRWMKEHITYPRTGYVVYHQPTRKNRVQRIILAAVLSIGLGGLIAALAEMRTTANQIAIIVGIVMAAMLVYLGIRFQLMRLYVLAALTIILGYFAARLNAQETVSYALFFAGFGLLMIGSGTTALLLYMNRIRPSQADDEMDMNNHEADPQMH